MKPYLTNVKLGLTLVLAGTGSGFAQLKAGSLTPAGGESYYVGQKVAIKWIQEKGNDGLYDFYFSKNGGTRWSEFEEGWQGPTTDNSEVTYEWTVPAGSETENGILRVCQMAGGHCSNPAYILASQAFTITTDPVGLQPRHENAGRFFAQGQNGRLSLAFHLEKVGKVSLTAKRADGRELGSLWKGSAEAGKTRLDLSPSALEGQTGTVFLQLSIDGQAFESAVLHL